MKFSLIIPVAPGRGAEIINSINNLDYPESEFEVVAVRGMNPSENRNLGARQAKGEILAFLDDDAAIPVGYLREAEKFFEKYPDVDIVGGPQLTSKEEQGFSRFSWYALSSIFGAWKVSNRYAVRRTRFNVDETAVSSANLLCKKRVMESISFDTGLFPGEDPKFIADAAKAGFNIAYYPSIFLYHRRRPTLTRLMQQIFTYGQARPLKETIRETMKMPFFFAPSLFLLYLIGLAVLMAVKPQLIGEALKAGGEFRQAPVMAKIIFLPLIVYAAAAVIFGIYDSIRNRDYKAVFVLPFIYPAIHLSYGLGMIRGHLKKLGLMSTFGPEKHLLL